MIIRVKEKEFEYRKIERDKRTKGRTNERRENEEESKDFEE